MNQVGERLIILMENFDMKQTELADKLGISKQSLYKYIHCKCEPRAEIIARMATVLNTTADYIVGLTDDPKPSDYTAEKAKKETELLTKFRKLSDDDKLRIAERIDILLEKQY